MRSFFIIAATVGAGYLIYRVWKSKAIGGY